MSVRPSLCCPTDFSILSFRFIENKKAAIVQGINTLNVLDLSSLNIPILQYKSGSIVLKAGSKTVLNVDDIGTLGPMKETYEFSVNLTDKPDVFNDGTTHNYYLFDSNNDLIESFSFTIDFNDEDNIDFKTAFLTAYNNTTDIKDLVSFDFTNIATGKFTVISALTEVKYRHEVVFDEGIPGPVYYTHPGNLIKRYRKYDSARVKFIMLFPDYDRSALNPSNILGIRKVPLCKDTNLVSSNKKYFEYVNLSTYNKYLNTTTPIYVAEPLSTGLTDLFWKYQSEDHINYHINTGDLISTVENPLYRARVISIDGYKITVDQPTTAALSSDQQLALEYSPNEVEYNKAGGFLFLSGATDIYDTDFTYIETILLNNPHTYDITIRYMIGV